jgi:23S rRNA pseudouridine2605 synthase
MSERLQKLLAAAGHGSRREIEQWIRAGRLTVDGQVAALGAKAGPGADIRLDGRALPFAAAGGVAREVLLYHKPVGEVTTRSDPQRRPTVFERLPPPRAGRWVVVGRLDVNTSGLLLFTTDGALAHRLMHPSSEIEREYLVRVRGTPGAAVLAQLRAGVMLEDGAARFELLEPLRGAAGEPGGHSSYRVILREGRNREVRRLWQSVGVEVSRLMRVRYGTLELPRDLKPGQWRLLESTDARRL